MSRRPDRALLALVPAMAAFIAFGAARVVAPVTLIGLIFHEPVGFAIAAVLLSTAGAVLLFVKPVELQVAKLIAPSRPPTAEESATIAPLLERVGAHAGIRTSRLIVRVEDNGELNASAGASHLLFVTTAALRRADLELEALLAHELGHHRALHPVGTAVMWWLSLPGEALLAIYLWFRRLALRLTYRVPILARLVQLVLLVYQVSVLWLYYVAQFLAAHAARLSEFSADRAAAEWGYGKPLAALLASVPEQLPATRLDRLRAEHPPIAARLAQLA